jgi:hypothetical protein
MLQQSDFNTQRTIPATSVQDLDPRPCAHNAHASVLPHEMTVVEPGENPTTDMPNSISYFTGSRLGCS